MNLQNLISKVIDCFWAVFTAPKPWNQMSTRRIMHQIKERQRKDDIERRRQVTSTKRTINIFAEKVLLSESNGSVPE